MAFDRILRISHWSLPVAGASSRNGPGAADIPGREPEDTRFTTINLKTPCKTNFSLFFARACWPFFALTSCDKNEDNDTPSSKLATPVLNITEQLSDGFTVSWQAVEHAAGYSYVFGNEAEKSTNTTSVSFSGLEPGTYTVKVKATAGSAEWSDSNYASISATIEEGTTPPTGEITFTFDITDITASSAVITCTPSVNDQTYFFDCMEKSQYDQIHTSDEVFTAALLESLEAMGAEYNMSLEQVLSQLLSTGVDVWDPNGLTSSTEYVAYAFGLNTDGTVTSTVSTKSFTTKEATGGSDTGSWLGEWDATSTGSLVWNISGQYLEASYDENRPMDRAAPAHRITCLWEN